VCGDVVAYESFTRRPGRTPVLRGARPRPRPHAGRPPYGRLRVCRDRVTARRGPHHRDLRPPRLFCSTIDDRDQDAEPDLLADDVRQVLEAVSDTPADVFGSSGGAVTGLALVARYPSHVRALVAHEPPLALLLSDADVARAGVEDIYGTYRKNGTRAAWQRFSAFTGMNMRPQGEDAMPGASATSERFFGHGLLPITLYQPDFPALRAASASVVVAGGTTSKGEFAQRTAVALAERLGTPLVDFPGGHGGFASDTKDFAAALRRSLA
jgi:pimeloyl-ACP methyl ester carboxylesterase